MSFEALQTELPIGMESQLLLYIGSGLSLGSLLLGPIVGVILAIKEQYKGFRYGAFFLGASLVLVPLQAIAVCCYYFQFLDDGRRCHQRQTASRDLLDRGKSIVISS